MRFLVAMFLVSFPALADFKFGVGTFVQQDTTITVRDSAGVSFAPKALLMVGTSLTAPGSAANGRMAIAFCTGTVGNGMAWFEGTDSGGSTANTSAHRSTADSSCDVYYEGTGVVAKGTITFTGTGFTRVLTVNDGTARVWNYLAWGGTDITVKVGDIAVPGSPGPVTVTTGFQPSVVFFLCASGASAYTPTTSGNANFTFGASVGTAASASIAGQSTSGVATSVANGIQAANAIQVTLSSGATPFAVGSVTSLSSTGFTVNYTTATASVSHLYLAIGGGNWAIGRTSQPASTGDQAIPVTGIHPVGALLFSANKTASTSYSTHFRNSIGATDGTHLFSSFAGIKGGATVQVASSNMSQSTVLNMMTEGGASPTTQATVDTVGFADNTLTPHWSAADATARAYAYLTFGTAVAGGGGGGGGTVKHKSTNQ